MFHWSIGEKKERRQLLSRLKGDEDGVERVVWCWSHSDDLTDSAKCALVWIASPGALLIMIARSTRLRACAETSASQSDGIKANVNTYKGYLIRKKTHPETPQQSRTRFEEESARIATTKM